MASWKGRPIELTATEFKLLTMLAQRAGRVQSRDQLAARRLGIRQPD